MRTFCAFLIAIAVLWVMPRNARAQLYVTQLPSFPHLVPGIVSEYDATTGDVIRRDFITGLGDARALVVKGNILFVANTAALNSGLVGKYDATTGGAINPGFVTGLKVSSGLAVEAITLLVADVFKDTVSEYAVSTGALINANFIENLHSPVALALFDEKSAFHGRRKILFVANSNTETIGKYNATTGETINASFITGLKRPIALALSGKKLFVANFNGKTGGEYDAETGAAINASFITGLKRPSGLAVSRHELFVTDGLAGTVGKYNAETGAALASSKT